MNNERLFSGKKKTKNEDSESILQKLPFRIIEVSSEEEGYPVTELLNHTPFSRGWQSSKFCDYPQEIVLEFPSAVRVMQIQFLSHQYKISSKLEISINTASDQVTRKFKKIGYLGLDPNDRSNFQARELKSVYIDYTVSKIKVALHRCHTNIHNTFLQVGIIAINILGEYLNKAGDNINMNNFVGGEVGTKLEEEMNYDPVTLKRLKNLYKAKEKAIELEDFDEAKKIKEAIERLKSVSQQLIQLEERKRIAIRNDDFDAAKMLKYEVERLRNAVAGIQIAGEGTNANNINNVNFSKGKPMPLNKRPIIREEQDEYDDIPMGREKVKLIPVNKKGNANELPLTSDLLMEEDNTKAVRNINPNKGYKLKDRDEIRAKVDVDQQVVKGIDKDFSEVVAEKMKKEGKGNNNANKQEEVEEDIPASEYKKAEPLIPVLSFDIVKLLFSKYWRNKEEGIKIISEEIQKHPSSELLSPHGVDKILTAVVGASAYILTCNISQPIMATMDMLKILFNKFRGNTIQGYLRQDFDNYVDQCMLLLIEKVGDTNLKLKEKAENTVMEFANSSLVGHKTVFEDLITGQVKKTLVKSARHLAGRLNLISRMINNFGLNSSEVPIEPLMAYAVNAYKDANKEVRDAAFNAIMNAYKYIGDNVKKYFKDLRPNQVNLLEEGFEGLDGLNQEGEVQNNEGQEEFLNESKMIYNETEKKGKEKKAVNDYEDDYQQKVSNDNFSSQNNTGNNANNANEDHQSCGICGFFDPSLDEDALQMHWYRECPMLTLCYKCKQVVEISQLNYHFQNECSNKKEFKQCARCKEMYHQSEYNQHVAEKLCFQAKSSNAANRCPLCHTDHTPAGKVGWEVHLLQNTCANNPRTSG